MKNFFLYFLSCLCVCIAQGQETAPAAAPEAPAALEQTDKWEKELQSIEKRLEKQKAPVGGIAFVGSSTMRLWNLEKHLAGLNVLNLGFGGATIPDQLKHFDRLLAKTKPKQVFFFCGGNDLSQKRTAEQVHADFQAWVAKMHALEPECRITFLSIRHSQARLALRETEKAANALVEAYCKKNAEKLTYLEMNDLTQNAAGEVQEAFFQKDKLHLNEAGYEKWTERVKPLLDLKLPH
jgi:lysophospholipase L1-like esterase